MLITVKCNNNKPALQWFVEKHQLKTSRLQRQGLNKKLAYSNELISRKKQKKPPFLGIWGQKGQFWTVFGDNG